MTTTTVLVVAALTAATAGAPAGKLAPEVSKEMMAAIVATNKTLGLESWPMHDVKPCIDRGGQGITAKEVTPDETRKCAAASLEKGFPELGKSYVLAIRMVEIGPVTVLAHRHRCQRRLGRLLLRPRPEVPAGEDRRRQQVGQADRRAPRPGLRRDHDSLVPRRQARVRWLGPHLSGRRRPHDAASRPLALQR